MTISRSVVRIARPTLAATSFHPSSPSRIVMRSYAQTPEQPLPADKPSKTSPLVLVATGTAVAAGLYWYYNRPEDVKRVNEVIQKSEEEAGFKTREIAEAGKARAQDMATQGREKYAEFKASGQDKLNSARSAAQDAEARARQTVADTRSQYDDTKAKLERKYSEGKAEADKLANDAKASWSSWWRWGNSRADQAKKSGAAKTAEVAEGTRKEAEKHT